MINNYIKIAWRNLVKNKGYSAINILGLAIGLATCLLITLYVTHQLSYDRYLPNADRIYRVNSDIQFGGGELHMTNTSDMMGQLLQQDYPEVESYARLYTNEGAKLIKKGTQFISEEHVAYVDSSFLHLFGLQLVAGDAATALSQPNTIVISSAIAKKYFGSVNVLGKNIEVKQGNQLQPFKIDAVMEDLPENSHMDFEFLLSMSNAKYNWGQIASHNFHTYLLLKPGTDYKTLEAKFPGYIEKHVVPGIRQFIDVKNADELNKSGNKLEYSLIPLTKIHLYSDYSFEIKPSGNIQYVYIFSAIAIFILVLACINFMNLSTARSARRAREVGIRKVLGTERKTLIAQFLTESTTTAILALIIALAIAFFALPGFNNIAATSLSMRSLLSVKILPFLLLAPFVVGLLAGSYPALFLSGFKPIAVLKSKTGGFKKSSLRNGLVVFQFAISIMLIIATIVVYNQLHYIQNKQLGFNKEQVLIIDDAYALENNVDAFKTAVLNMPGVSSGTISGYLPVSSSSRNDQTYSKTPVISMETGVDMQTWRVDYDYIKTMGMEIVKGRNFSREYGSDSSAIIITETTAKLFDLDDPIGKLIYAPASDRPQSYMKPLTIIGVVKDFHFESMKQKLGPLCMRLQRNTNLASFKVAATNTSQLISQVEQTWKAMAPGMPFHYRFMSDSFDAMYKSEQRAGTIAIVFASLAIFIACLGLFGLATYMAEQRNKEIGIRKVLGATVSGVSIMLSKDFIKLVLVAIVIASPIAWISMHKWLDDFVYRTQISWWIFALAAFIAIGIAIFTVSFNAIKAALANPIKSLRTE